MNKYHYILIGVVSIAALIGVGYILHQRQGFGGEFQEKLKEKEMIQSPEIREKIEELRSHKEDIRKMIEFTPLTEEDVEEAQRIAQSDDMINAILQVLDEYDVGTVRGPMDMVVLRYSSEKEWVLQVVVSLDSQTVESASLTRGITPGIDPQKLMEIAEKNFPMQRLGPPVMRKVFQSGNNTEVVYLTDEGTYRMKIDVDQEKIVDLKEERLRAFQWLPWIVLGAVLVTGAIIFSAVRKRRSGSDEGNPERGVEEIEEEPAESESQ